MSRATRETWIDRCLFVKAGMPRRWVTAAPYATWNDLITGTGTHYEGYTGTDWDEWLCLADFSDQAAECTVEYNTPGGVWPRYYTLPAASCFFIRVSDEMGPIYVSMKVEANRPILAERQMIFNYIGSNTGINIASGPTSTSNDWYFSSGTTMEGFDGYILIWNPTNNDTDVNIAYGEEGIGLHNQSFTLFAHSRLHVSVRDVIGDGRSYSVHVSAAQPIICEHSIYYTYDSPYLDGTCIGGSIISGSTSLSKQFYIPGGPIGPKYEQWVCLANFGSSATKAALSMIRSPSAPPPVSAR